MVVMTEQGVNGRGQQTQGCNDETNLNANSVLPIGHYL